jgi:DNA-binding ferritin-like protein
MKDIVKIDNLVSELRSAGMEDSADNIERKVEELYLMRMRSRKNAQEDVASEPKKAEIQAGPVMEFLACLKLNLTYTQAAHWISKGDSAYGDHLLYERLYNENVEEIDKYAEKFIPMAGESIVDPAEILSISAEKMPKVAKFSAGMSGEELAEGVLRCEKYVLAELEKLHEGLKESGNMTLGLDDLLPEMHNLHEGHVYLVGQRLK